MRQQRRFVVVLVGVALLVSGCSGSTGEYSVTVSQPSTGDVFENATNARTGTTHWAGYPQAIVTVPISVNQSWIGPDGNWSGPHGNWTSPDQTPGDDVTDVPRVEAVAFENGTAERIESWYLDPANGTGDSQYEFTDDTESASKRFQLRATVNDKVLDRVNITLRRADG